MGESMSVCGATMKVTLLLPLISCCLAAPQYQAAPAPYQDLSEPPAYAYQYGVNDDYSGANFQQQETRDGYTTSGSYTVALPDGRVQTVTYHDGGDRAGHQGREQRPRPACPARRLRGAEGERRGPDERASRR